MTVTTVGSTRGRGERASMIATGWDASLAHVDDGAPEAPLADGQVRIDVEACGVCHRDLIDRDGRFAFIQLPIVPGHEAAGRIVEIGPGVTEWRVGDRVGTMHRDACGACPQCLEGATSLCDRAAWVFGILVDGGYARSLVSPGSALFALPDDLPAPEAAVLHCTFGTAWRDIVTLGELRAGQRFLVTGANGGVGSAAVQIAARLGAEVVAVVRDERHAAFVRALGAHDVIVDTAGTFHQNSGRFDLVLEAVGYSTFNASLRALRIGGRMVVVGNVVPEKVALNLGYVITHGLRIIGGSGATRTEMKDLLASHAAQPFRVAIDRVLPLGRADEAQRAVRAGGLEGRVVVVPSREAVR